jgi:hypothetical protein
MITPEEIRQKAERAYPRILSAWAHGELGPQFPMRLPANLSTIAGDLPATIAAIDRLRAKSKEQCGSGYSIQWRQIRSRDFGNNLFPDQIIIDTLDDLLSLCGKQKHFAASCRAAERLRDQLPGLAGWIVDRVRELAEITEPLDGLIQVTRFFLDNPWPDCYARQIPVATDTKFVERHQSVLRQWLDALLPSSAIQPDETKFALRYGLRDGQPHTTIRTLDLELQAELGLPFDELSLPLRHLATLPVNDATVVIVENRLNLLTLPPMIRGIAIRGEGKAVTRLARLTWLADNNALYWGDIDVEGFQILSSLRSIFPHVRSILMTDAVLRDHSQLMVEGNGTSCREPNNLSEEELAAFRTCLDQNQRLEQERLHQPYVDAEIRRVEGSRAGSQKK